MEATRLMKGYERSSVAALVGSPVFNAIWFQSLWFCAVLGREALVPVTAAMLCLHLWLVGNRRREFRQIALVAAVGIAGDALLSVAGVFQFSGGVLVPLWLCLLWCAFATTLSRGLAFLGRHPWLGAVCGAVAMPFNYWAGQKLGAVEFGVPLVVALGAMAALWAVALPLVARGVIRLQSETEED